MPIFQTERSASKGVIGWVKSAKMVFIASTAVGLVTPIFFTQSLDRPTKGMLNFLAIVGCASWIAADNATKRMVNIDKLHDKEQLEQFKRGSQHRSRFTAAQEEIAGYAELVSHVLSRPIWEWGRWEKDHGLQGLLPPLQHPEVAEAIAPNWTGQPLDPGTINTVERKPPEVPQPSLDWIVKLVELTAEPDPEKRRNHHIVINGPTQYGKSTLCSLILILLAKRLSTLGLGLKINLIDPKYPMSKWFVEPSFVGYDQVAEGVEEIRTELENRKKIFTQAKRSNKPFPRLDFYAAITDEWDSIWSEGKGYGAGETISKEEAQRIRGTELNAFKEGAAFNICNIIMGQSALSGASGFSRSDLNNATRIVLGIEAVKWVSDAGFPFKDMKEELSAQLNYWMQRSERAALIIPNNGLPFVAPVPREAKEIVEAFCDGRDILEVKTQVRPEAPSNPDADWLTELQRWATSLDHNPNPEEIKAQFKALAKSLKLEVTDLSDRDVDMLREYIEQWRQN